MIKHHLLNLFLIRTLSLIIVFTSWAISTVGHAEWSMAGYSGATSCSSSPPPGYDEDEYTFGSASMERCIDNLDRANTMSTSTTFTACRVYEFSTEDGDLFCSADMWGETECPANHYHAADGQCTPVDQHNQGPPDQCGGTNPINILTGNKYQQEVDYVGRGFFPLRYVRIYNSDARGWMLPHQWLSFKPFHTPDPVPNSNDLEIKQLYVSPKYSPLNLFYTSASGEVNHFHKTSDHTYHSVTDPAITMSVIQNDDGNFSYRVEDKQGEVIDLDHRGRLLKRTHRTGISHTYAYQDELITITHDNGDTLILTHDIKGRVIRLEQSDGQAVHYTYHSDNHLLATVIYPDAQYPRRYHYENSDFPWALTGITDENNNRYGTWTYDEAGRANSFQLGDNTSNISIDYSQVDSDNPRVLLTSALNKVSTYTIGDFNGHKKTLSIHGHASDHCAAANQAYTYDDHGFITSKTDWGGQVTTYIHNERGLETSRTEAVDTEFSRTFRTIWHDDVDLPLYTMTPYTFTEYQYDDRFRLTHTRVKNNTIDEDGDTLPDYWELYYFSSLSHDGSGDFNNNGVSDRDEWISQLDPTAPTVTRHRYWRLTHLTLNDSWFEIADIELAVDEVSMNTQATISSSAPATYGSIVDITDRNSSTRAYWPATTATGSDFYLMWDFGQNPQAINQVRQAGFDSSGRHLSGFTLEYSDDGITWTAQNTQSGLSYPGNYSYSSYYATAPVEPINTTEPSQNNEPEPTEASEMAHNYWRLTYLDVNGSWFEIADIELALDGVGMNAQATISSSAPATYGSIVDITDGNPTTRAYWPATTATAPDFYLMWNFADNPLSIHQVRQAGFDTAGRHLAGFTVQYSDDGITWTTLSTQSGLLYPGNHSFSPYYYVSE